MNKPMTKIEALKAAQDSQVSAAKHGEHYDLFHEPLTLCWTLRRRDNTIVEKFPYEDPKPLAQDTLVLDKHSGVYRYATGELRDNRNCFYPAGHCSRTWNDVIGGIVYLRDDQFEIIETPTDFETMQTPDEMCVQFKCGTYKHKYTYETHEDYTQGNKTLNEHCQRCRISVSEPSGLKGE